MRANGALSCTRLEVSLRTSQKHLANNSAVLTKAQLLDKVSKHLPVTNGALETDRAFGVTPMRANGALSCTRHGGELANLPEALS